jgi:hypothetical protein
MRLSLLAALAAATALVPAAASAQDHDRGGWHGNGDRGQRGDRGQPAEARPAPPARPAAAPQARPAFQPGARPGGFDRGNAPRPDRPQGFQRPDQPQGFARPQDFQRPDRTPGDTRQGFRPGAATRDFPARRAPGFDGNRPDGSFHAEAGGPHAGDRDGRPGWNGDRNGRPGWDGDRNNRPGWNGDRNGRPDVNRGGDRDGQWGRGRDDRNGGFDRDRRGDRDAWRGDRNGWHGDNRGSFNRDWRRDRRYDWRDYRTTNRGLYHLPRYYAPYGWDYGYRRFGIGFTLDSILFGSNYWISDPYYYRLPPAYGPYRWVRYYDDALLVDIRTGYVVDVVYDIFW